MAVMLIGVIRNTILNNVQSDVAETTATRGSNDRRMCFDRRGVIFAVLDEFQSLYFANVIYCSKNGSRSIPYLAGNLVCVYGKIFSQTLSSAVHCGRTRLEMRSKLFFHGVSMPWNLAFLEDMQRHTQGQRRTWLGGYATRIARC